MMTSFQDIDEARILLELPEYATMKEIKANYRRLLRRWHPDRHGEHAEQCAEMTRRLVDAYETIITYCKNYRYSFTEEEVITYGSDEDWWMKRFGSDPIWGDLKKRK